MTLRSFGTSSASGPATGRVLRNWSRSGWPPALLVFAVAVLLLRHTGGVDGPSVLVYALWFLWAHTVPGVLLWRLVDHRQTARPFVEDVALGTALGVIAGVAVYLVLLAIGVPYLVALWPLGVLAPLIATSRGRRVLWVRQDRPTPVWWSWALAALALYVLASLSLYGWPVAVLTPEKLRAPYVDMPFHLALTGEFRFHFPADYPYVSGVPLKYHWLVYPLLAMGTWGTGIESPVVLGLLGPTALVGLLVLGLAAGTARLAGHRVAGLLAVVLCVVATPADTLGWTDAASPFNVSRWFGALSPTQILVTALTPFLVVVLSDLLTAPVAHPRRWVLGAIALLAIAGAKSSMLPLVIAGLAGTSMLMWLIWRRIPWRLLGVTGLSLVVFQLATWIFYGPGARSLRWGPFEFFDVQSQAVGLAAPDGSTPTPALVTIVVSFVLALLIQYAGMAGHLPRSGWRSPVPWVLLGIVTSALLILSLASHPGLSQVYFLFCAVVPGAMLAALGFTRSLTPLSVRGAAKLVGATVVGWIAALLIAALTSKTRPSDTDGGVWGRLGASYILPLTLAVAVIVVVAVLGRVVRRRNEGRSKGRNEGWPSGLALGLATALGICLVQPVAMTQRFLTEGPPVGAINLGPPVVKVGGLRATRWLREHAGPDDVIATNLHSYTEDADHRQFWISGYSERRVLVEGWDYVPPELVGLPSTDAKLLPRFWDPELLALNDRAIIRAQPRDLARLRDDHGVVWLFVDKTQRPRPDIAQLRQNAQLRLRTPNYLVFSLD